jgi:hypothetical protein
MCLPPAMQARGLTFRKTNGISHRFGALIGHESVPFTLMEGKMHHTWIAKMWRPYEIDAILDQA